MKESEKERVDILLKDKQKYRVSVLSRSASEVNDIIPKTHIT